MQLSLIHLRAVAIRFILFWLLYMVSGAIYSIYFGPLSRIPGPKLAAATRFVSLYHKLRGNGEAWRKGLHKQYGDVVRPSPTDVSFASGKAWKEIYGYAQGSRFQKNQNDPRFYVRRPTSGNMIVADDVNHARQRRAFSNAFSDKALKEQEPLLQKYVEQLVSNLHEVAGNDAPVNIVEAYNCTTFDIMSDLAWGESLGCLQNSEYAPWVSLVFAAIKVGSISTELDYFPILSKLIALLIPASLTKKRAEHFRNSADRVDKRIARQDQDPRPDIWGLVLTSKEDQKLSLREMHGNAQLFMAAGTETTATLLSGLTYHLLMNPDKMVLIKTEIRDTFPAAEDINVTKLANLSYLNACIEEALRIYPPVPNGLPRAIASGGTYICGYYIPENTAASVHQLSTNHSPRNFHSPDLFHPERWLVANPKSTLYDPTSPYFNDDRSAVQPFSVGPRNCLGISLAWLEMRLIAATVFHNFDLTLCEQSRRWNEQKTYNLWAKGELMVRVTSTA